MGLPVVGRGGHPEIGRIYADVGHALACDTGLLGATVLTTEGA